VRGFGFQELGPRVEVANPKFDPTDPDEKDDPTISVPTGGRSLVEFALEGRYRFGNYGVVGFVDAGQVYESQTPSSPTCASESASAAGSTPISARCGLDVAVPIGRRKGESKFAIYVSIGQAF
jgi:translocation and assembly module TamA